MEIDSFSESERDRWLPSLRRLAGVALTLGCLGVAALLMNLRSWNSGGVTILWPSNGLLIGIILCAPRRYWPAYLTVGFAVDLGINLSLTFYFWNSVYLAACNMLEVGLAAILLYRSISPKPDLTQRKQLINLLVYGVILAPAVASLLAQFNMARAHSLPLLVSFKFWFTADALGIAVMTPLYLSFSQSNRFSGKSRLEIAGLLAMLCGAALFVFSRTGVPLLFLLLPLLLVLGVRLRLAGSALGLLIISIVGGFFTSASRGPIMLTHLGSASLRDLALQFFIAVSMLMLYVVEVVIAERERLQANLQDSETRFRLLAEASNDVIVLADLVGNRRYVSPAVTAMLGWQPEELIGHNYQQIVHPDDLDGIRSLMELCREGKPVGALAYRCRKKDGDYLWMEASIRLYCDDVTGKAKGFVNVVRDISSRKAAEDELNLAFRLVENLAMVDGLTGAANRRRFDETMDREWRRAMRDGSPLSLLLIDVDNFKPYNDVYGHVLGDACLRQVVTAAQEVIHRTSDLFARYGGEEFAVVLPNTDSKGAQLVAEQIRSAVAQRGLPHSSNPPGIVTVSIGCATRILTHDSTVDLLLKAADEALYQAKSAGRNCVEVAEALPASD